MAKVVVVLCHNGATAEWHKTTAALDSPLELLVGQIYSIELRAPMTEETRTKHYLV